MIKVGITGSMGSGKSTVCKIFETLGTPIYYADDRAKQLMQENDQLIASIKEMFGEAAYTGTQLNREFIANKVFNDKFQLQKLNGLVHPAVFTDVKHWMKKHNNKPYAIEEAALLFETGSNKFLDKTITVHAPMEQRIKRVKERDNSTRKQIVARMLHQLNDEEKMRLADFVIYNDGKHKLIHQVLAIHHILIANSKLIAD